MDGLYTESYVKKQLSAGKQVLKFCLIVVSIVLLLGGMYTGIGLISLLGVVAIVLVFYLLIPNMKVDYECIFCDGQFDFDKIKGGEKRSHVLTIDMDNIEIIAPERSHALDGYNNRQVDKHDFSSEDPNALRYKIYGSVDGKQVCIVFEPTEKMVEFARQKSPRKVFTY